LGALHRLQFSQLGHLPDAQGFDGVVCAQQFIKASRETFNQPAPVGTERFDFGGRFDQQSPACSLDVFGNHSGTPVGADPNQRDGKQQSGKAQHSCPRFRPTGKIALGRLILMNPDLGKKLDATTMDRSNNGLAAAAVAQRLARPSHGLSNGRILTADPAARAGSALSKLNSLGTWV